MCTGAVRGAPDGGALKIGIDAKWYFRGPPSGRRVVRNLVKHTLAAPGGDEIHVFTDRDFRESPLDVAIAPGRRHHVWAGNNQLSNLAIVPRVADRLALDAVVYQNFVPLRAHRHARVAMVYDAIFETHPQFFTPLERMYFAPLPYLTRNADRVCTGSHSERARLAALGYAHPDRIDVVPNGVDGVFLAVQTGDDERRELLRHFQLPERFVLFVGRVTARKNLGALVAAIALLDEPIHLVVAGAADDTVSGLLALIRENAMAKRVHAIGAVDDPTLRALYSAATVFCFPSFDEGFGLPPLEAMALGAPCVVSDIAVLREVCGDAAYYADPADPASLAQALHAAMVEPDAGKRSAGIARAAGYRWEAAAAALLACVRATSRVSA